MVAAMSFEVKDGDQLISCAIFEKLKVYATVNYMSGLKKVIFLVWHRGPHEDSSRAGRCAPLVYYVSRNIQYKEQLIDHQYE